VGRLRGHLARPLDRLIRETDPAAAGTGERLRTYAAVVVALAGVTAAFEPIKATAGLLNIGLVYLVVVVAAATLGGRRPGIVAAVGGFLLFNFFLVPPYLTLVVHGLENILALFVFLGLAVLISTLIARARSEAAQALRRASDVQRLYRLGQAALAATGTAGVLPALIAQVVDIYEAAAGWIVLPGDDGPALRVAAQAPAGAPPLEGELADLAQAVYRRNLPQGIGPPATPGHPARLHTLFAPLRAEGQVVGVLGVTTQPPGRAFTLAEQAVLLPLADQVALALDRLRLRDEATRAELLAHTDQLKSALLHAVSHDLRTPLASIKATVTSLLDPAVDWDPATRRVLLEGVDEECDRLTRLVSNLLDMSRIEGGGLRLERDWYAFGEVVDTVRRRLAPRLADHPLTVAIPADLPLVPMDFVKIDGVLTNVLENAITYTPPGTPIRIAAQAGPDVLAVTVADEGPGVAPQHLAHLFDKFYRVGANEHPAGSGLGLAIARGMVEAHGGTISARGGPPGLVITFTLPLTVPDGGPPAWPVPPREPARIDDGR
jgi:two-component system sensor histidine kinase KdpD